MNELDDLFFGRQRRLAFGNRSQCRRGGQTRRLGAHHQLAITVDVGLHADEAEVNDVVGLLNFVLEVINKAFQSQLDAHVRDRHAFDRILQDLSWKNRAQR